MRTKRYRNHGHDPRSFYRLKEHVAKKKKKFPKRRRTSAPSKPPRGDLMDLNFARTRTSARTRITCENQRRLYEPAYSVRRRRRCHVSVIYWDRKLRLGPVGFGHGCRCLPARVVYGRLYLCRGPDCVRTKYNRVHEHATALSTQRTRRVTYESFKRTKADGGGGGGHAVKEFDRRSTECARDTVKYVWA